MPTYRIYWLDQDNHIIRADNLIAASDEEASEKAESLLGLAPAIEVWRGEQYISRVSAKKSQT